MSKALIKRILLLLLPVVFTILVPQLLIDRPALSKAWGVFGPTIISATEDALKEPAEPTYKSNTPLVLPQPTTRPQPSIRSPIIVKFPGGGVEVPAKPRSPSS